MAGSPSSRPGRVGHAPGPGPSIRSVAVATLVALSVLVVSWLVRPSALWPTVVIVAAVLAVEIWVEGSVEESVEESRALPPLREPALGVTSSRTTEVAGSRAEGVGPDQLLDRYLQRLADPFSERQCIRCGLSAVVSTGAEHRCTVCGTEWERVVDAPWPDTVVDARRLRSDGVTVLSNTTRRADDV